MNFSSTIPLSNIIYENLSRNGITEPSPVQSAAIAPVLDGKDVIAVSPTGTGKTLAYLLPVFSVLKNDIAKPQAVILAPTHELAAQIKREADIYALGTDIKSTLLIGGANIDRQLAVLKGKPQIIIGAAGRIIELYSLKKLTLHFVKTIVIDEADRLLNEKNIDQIKAVINATQKDRQLLFFSASMSKTAVETARNLSKNPEMINIDKPNAMPDSIEHIYFECEKRDKVETLRKIIHSLKIKKAIVFSGSQNEAENTAAKLNYHGTTAVSLCGQTLKEDRRLALLAFREGRVVVLSATDIAARGLDIKDVDFIICMDTPSDTDVYRHRAGRTGRMNRKGTAISIVTPDEAYRLNRIEKAFEIKIIKSEVTRGKVLKT